MLMLNFQDLFPFGIEQLLEVLQLLVFVPLLPHYILPYFTLPKSLTCSGIKIAQIVISFSVDLTKIEMSR